MRKGNKVAVRAGADLWASTTDEDRREWRAGLDAEAARLRAEGKDTFSVYMDCGGESRLAPRSKRRSETAGDWTVVRARASAKRGWHTVSGACLIRHSDGTEWYAFRKDVAVVGGGTGPKPKAPKALEGTDADIAAWVEVVNAKYPLPFGATRKVEFGRKFARVYKVYKVGKGVGRSAYCFVDRSNGTILKTAGWKGPAKGARGNIYAADPLAGVGMYGAAYLR